MLWLAVVRRASFEMSDRPRTPARKRLVGALVAATATLATLAAAEVAVRVAGLDRGTTDRLRYHSEFGWTINPERPTLDGVRPSGFRHPPIAAEKPSGTRRLLILGDSFAQGSAYPYAETFAGLLGSWLAVPGERWEVVNLGVSGWGTAQQLLAFEELAAAIDPDVAVLQIFPYNDVCNNSRALAMACDSEDFYRPYLDPAGGVGELRRSWMHPVGARLRAVSALFRAVERRSFLGLGPPKPPADLSHRERQLWTMELRRTHANAVGIDSRMSLQTMVPDRLQAPVIRQAWEITEALLGRLVDGLDRRGVPWIAMVAPNPRSFDPAWVQNVRTSDGWPRGAPVEPGYETGRVEAYLAGLGGRSIDLRNRVLAGPMEGADHFHPYGKMNDLHLNRLGHFRVAGWILEELAALGLTTAEPPAPDLGAADLVGGRGPTPVSVRGLRRRGRAKKPPVRVANRGEVEIAFRAAEAVPMALRFELEGPLAGSPVRLAVNGEESSLAVGPDGELIHRLAFTSQPGRNEIRFVSDGFDPGRREMARFSVLALEPRAGKRVEPAGE